MISNFSVVSPKEDDMNDFYPNVSVCNVVEMSIIPNVVLFDLREDTKAKVIGVYMFNRFRRNI